MWLGFCFLQTLLLQRKMGPKKGRRQGKIEVPKDTPTESELEDTAADIQRRRGQRDERDRKDKETEGGDVKGGSHVGGNYTLSRGGSGQKKCKDREK